MQASFDRGAVCLSARGLFEIADASGVEIACTRGSLWVTLDDDPRDIVLETGESFFTTEHRRAIVYAFERASLRLTERGTPAVQPSVRLSDAKNSSDWRRSPSVWAATRAAISG